MTMKRALEDLWNGSLAPCEKCGENDPEVENMARLIERNRDTLQKELGERQKEILNRYTGCYEEYLYLTAVHAFCDGFSLASRLLTEALAKNP